MDSVIVSEGLRAYGAIFSLSFDNTTTGKNIIDTVWLFNDITTQTGKESGRFRAGTAESQKGEEMAPGGVHAGYKNSLYMYAAEKKSDLEASFEEWLVELTTGLELALEGGMGDNGLDSNEGADNLQEDGQTETYSARKKEWEEILEQAEVVEAMLRQALGNGLGRQKEEENTRQKNKEEEHDNEFSLEGVPMPAEGKIKSEAKTKEASAGGSKSFQSNSGKNAEYLHLANGGRKQAKEVPVRMRCLTCETHCDQKKQWKITE